MARFFPHESIAAGVFNRSFSAADGLGGGASVWRDALQNTVETLRLLLERMGGDFAAAHVRMRKPWKTGDLVIISVWPCV